MFQQVKSLQVNVRARVRTESSFGHGYLNQHAVPIEWFAHVRNPQQLREARRNAIERYIFERFGAAGAKAYRKEKSEYKRYRTAANAVARAVDRASRLYQWKFPARTKHKPGKAETSRSGEGQTSNFRAAMLQLLETFYGSSEERSCLIEQWGDASNGGVVVEWTIR